MFITDALKNFEMVRLQLEDLIELSANARMLEAENVANGNPVPEWLTVAGKSLRREIKSRLADQKEKMLRDMKARRASLKTTEEKRAELDKMIADLETEVTV
jgi:hypothetical protein